MALDAVTAAYIENTTYIENTQTMRGFTRPLLERLAVKRYQNGLYQWTDLGDTTGAPWEIHIKSIESGDQMTSWGTVPYSEQSGEAGQSNGPGGVWLAGTINDLQAEILGNDIYRILKYYLQEKYSNIESVRLNIVLKFHPS